MKNPESAPYCGAFFFYLFYAYIVRSVTGCPLAYANDWAANAQSADRKIFSGADYPLDGLNFKYFFYARNEC